MTAPTEEDYLLPFDGTVFAPLTASMKTTYSDAWLVYSRIGPLTAHQFVSYDEKSQYMLGRRLHIEAYPDIEWPCN
jgi:hypothetical protein